MKKVARGIATNEYGEVLVGLRSVQMGHEGVWEFPGGNVDHGETNSQAVIREVWEETGAVVTDVGKYPIFKVQTNGLLIFFYEIRISRTKEYRPTNMEHEKVMWIRPEYLPSLKLSVGHSSKLLLSVLRHNLENSRMLMEEAEKDLVTKLKVN